MNILPCDTENSINVPHRMAIQQTRGIHPIVSMLVQHRRRWASIEKALDERPWCRIMTLCIICGLQIVLVKFLCIGTDYSLATSLVN